MSCTYMPDAPSEVLSDEDLYLNVANGNANVPAEMLGALFDSHQIKVADLPLAKMALSTVNPMNWVDNPFEPTPGESYMHCGRIRVQMEGYKTKLTEIVQFCMDNQVDLVWG